MSTFGVVSRITRSELPYLRAFVDHHKSVGFSSFEFVHRRVDEHDELQAWCDNIPGVNLTLATRFLDSSGRHVKKLLHEPIFEGRGLDYILNVDPDEYFIPKNNPSGNLDDWIEQFGSDMSVLKARWMMAPWDKHTDPTLSGGFPGHQGKCLLKVGCVKRVTEHGAKPLMGGRCYIPRDAGVLVHCWGRTFNDIVIKSFSYDFRNAKNAGPDQLRADLRRSILPPRLRLLAFLTRKAERRAPVPFKLAPSYDYAYEAARVSELVSPEELQRCKDLYARYKRRLPAHHFRRYPGNHLHGVVNKLPKKL